VLLSLLALFAAFFCCSLAQQYFLLQLRRHLATRHHKEWCEISEALFIRRATIRFALDKRDELLHDPDLTRIARRVRLMRYVIIATWVTYAASIVATTVVYMR
jgi:hypothetical protein